MATIESVLAVIERSNLVSSDVVSELKHRLEKSKHEADVRTAVKWLVAKEHITLAQGQRLLQQQPPSQADTRTAPLDDDDELELLPLDDERAGTRPRSKPAPSDEDLEIFSSPPPAPRAAPTERPVQPGGGARWLGTPRPAAPPHPAPQPSRAPAAKPVAPPRLDELFGEGALYDAMLADEAEARRPPPADRSVWDSPLLLIGGGSLLLLLILGAFLVWRLNRETGDQALAAAEADYKAGSYVQAINKFNHYLQRHESHVGVSLARVHRGMALMRQAVENSTNWPKTLDTAKKIVSEISTEKEFPEARLELAALLPTIAEGLAEQAAEQGDAAMVEQSREALAMIDKYVPRSMHPTQRMTDVTALLAITTRRLNRDVSLEKAIAGIQQAVERGNTQAAYDLRRQLLKAYPELASSERLQEAVAAVSQAQLGGVSYKSDRRAAEQGAPESVIESEAPLAAGTPGSAPGVGGQVVYALGGGSAWGLDASTGRLLWRRFVGFDTDFVPRGITADPLSDALVVDAARHELLRVDGRTGEPRWRHPIGEAFDAHPVVLRDRVFIATRAGRLIAIELETGESPGFVQIPQGLRVGPVFDAREQFFYQLGENANLYVLSMDGGQCHQVLYLGHEPESIRVPPLVVSRYLIIAENRGATDSVLRVLLSDENGLSLRQVQADIPLSGHVFAPLVAADRTLVVATNRGALYSFEISAPGQGSPLTKSTEKPAEDISPRIRFPLLRGGQLWIAGGDLTRYDIQSARGRL
ncbi:MAG: PQQ-binding-like beta-propeller repeat protein, partial [Pirellulales bacterium]